MNIETSKNHRILVVDDNRLIHDDFRKILQIDSRNDGLDAAAAELFGSSGTEHESFEIDYAFQGQEALEKVLAANQSDRPFAMAFIDMRMPPGWDGLETIARIWQVDSNIQIVLSTAYSDYSWEQIIDKLGISDRLLILKKPFDPVEVRQLAYAMTEKWDLTRRVNLKLHELQRVINEHSKHLNTTAPRVAPPTVSNPI